jgi:hypothetical protein
MDRLPFVSQVALSKFEPNEYLNDRYTVMDERIQVNRGKALFNPPNCRFMTYKFA